jgi:carboxypeptidase Q
VQFKSFLRNLTVVLVVMTGARAAAQIPAVHDKLAPKLPPGSGACSAAATCADVAPTIIKSAMGDSPLVENLRQLTDEIGGRVTGSPAAARAVQWGVAAFRAASVDEVHTENFMVPVGWSEGATRVDILTPAPFPVHLVSIGWSPPTPEGGITASVVDAGLGDAAGFAGAGSAAQGAIVLVHSHLLSTWDDLMREYNIAPGVIDRAIHAGAAAIFWMSTRPNLLLYRHNVSIDGTLERLPQAVLAREDAERIVRLLAAGKNVRVHFEMPNRVTGPVQSENVVAEIRGREKPDEFVLLGAHLDSWELGTGALDNGCNAALVIDAARAIHSTGSLPRRSIRFVLFTGEEQGLLGSWAYARDHRADLNRMDAAIIYDSGIGRVTGYSVGGRKDIVDRVREVLEPAKPLGVAEFTTDADSGTDNFDFLLEGVPTLVANQEPANYMLNYHAASDTLDKVDLGQLKKHVAIAAITAYAIADSAGRIGKRQSRVEIETLLRETGLDHDMQQTGFTPLWQNGTRGRQQ